MAADVAAHQGAHDGLAEAGAGVVEAEAGAHLRAKTDRKEGTQPVIPLRRRQAVVGDTGNTQEYIEEYASGAESWVSGPASEAGGWSDAEVDVASEASGPADATWLRRWQRAQANEDTHTHAHTAQEVEQTETYNEAEKEQVTPQATHWEQEIADAESEDARVCREREREWEDAIALWEQDEEQEQQQEDSNEADNGRNAGHKRGREDAQEESEQSKGARQSSEEATEAVQTGEIAAGTQQARTETVAHTCSGEDNEGSQRTNSQETPRKRGREGGDAPLSQRRPRRDGHKAASPAAPSTQKRSKRTRAPGAPPVGRIERGFKKRKLVEQIAVSTTTVDRTVGGLYEWRVATYRRTESGKRQRTIVFDDGG